MQSLDQVGFTAQGYWKIGRAIALNLKWKADEFGAGYTGC